MDIDMGAAARQLIDVGDIEKKTRSAKQKQERELFAMALRRELRRAGRSQKQVAEAVGVSPSLVSSWCNGLCLPSGPQLQMLSILLDRDVSAWIDTAKSIVEPSPQTTKPAFTPEEEALINRVRRMSDEERDGLYALLHVLR